ncbi:hypothetical protein ALQ90_200142 [Pseudomonas savastanoi pv. savastanoi]|nr:hypothetical protein ALQ90_200142 [Pseudomonas savastanoi pv. savastanoi]
MLKHRGGGRCQERKLVALASLCDHVQENNALTGGNLVHGLKRPRIETSKGKTPLGDHQACYR